jgi:hypothetical protein
MPVEYIFRAGLMASHEMGGDTGFIVIGSSFPRLMKQVAGLVESAGEFGLHPVGT